jgi:hypothetical protein
MTATNTTRRQARRASTGHAKAQALERVLARFRARHRAQISSLAAQHPRLADLAATFPGLLFALSSPGHGLDPRPAIDLAIEGAPLRKIAAAARIPLWLRRLPPEAFDAALDRLPDGDDFRCRIASRLPRSPKLASIWLQTVADAARWGNSQMALWVARELIRNAKDFKLERIRLLALYAWYSARSDTAAHRLIRKAWHEDMCLPTAVEEAAEWCTALDLKLNLGCGAIDPWLEPCAVMGFDFVPLCSEAQIVQEASAMRNCVRTYGSDLVHNRSRLWSIRRNGARVATISVGFRGQPIFNILQLKGPSNSQAPKEIWAAARCWLVRHDLMTIEPSKVGRVPLDRSAWTETWRPYWLSKRSIPDWLPLAPSRGALNRLSACA